MTETIDPSLAADTSDMVGLHRVFRLALDAAPQIIATVTPGDTERADVVGSYYEHVLKLLEVHHEGEDELLTPKLIKRCPSEADTITYVAAQHHSVRTALNQTTARLQEWRSHPSGERGDTLMSTLAELESVLSRHLDDEEQLILPIAARVVSISEWAELPRHGMQNLGGDKQWLIAGLIREQMTPAQRSSMDANMPPQMLAMWTAHGMSAFKAFMTDLRGAAAR